MSLQNSDQESLKGLLGSCKKTPEEACIFCLSFHILNLLFWYKSLNFSHWTLWKIQERNEDEDNYTEEKYPKKPKVCKGHLRNDAHWSRISSPNLFAYSSI